MLNLCKKRIKLLVAACFIQLVFGIGAVSAADITLRLGHLANETNSWHLASVKFAQELRTLSKGRIDVQVFPNESLGKEIDLINGMQLGTVDMTITGESLQNWAPKAALLAIPYAYHSLDHMDKIASGIVGEHIKKQIIQKAQIRPIAYFARGPRNLTSNRPIKSPADLQDLKMRVPNVPLFLDVWKALGAAPTPMAFSEVFTSLQSGVIDAQENPLALIKSANFNEVQSHVNKTEHVRSWIYLTISEKRWANLTTADKKNVDEAAKRAQKYERGLLLASLAADQAYLESKGMTFVDVDHSAFSAAAKNVVLENVSDEIKPIVEGLFNQ